MDHSYNDRERTRYKKFIFLTLSEFVSLFKSEGATVVSEAFNADNITFAMGQVYSKKRNSQLLFNSSQLLRIDFQFDGLIYDCNLSLPVLTHCLDSLHE